MRQRMVAENREVESHHPLEEGKVGLGGEMLGELFAECLGDGLGLVGREAGVFQFAGETQSIDGGGSHECAPGVDGDYSCGKRVCRVEMRTPLPRTLIMNLT